jgi:hypothetical protein
MLPITDKNIEISCRKFGAKAVSDAAYSRMTGSRVALHAVDLMDAGNMAEANQVSSVAYALMSPDEAAQDYVIAVIDTAKLKC